MKSLKKLTLSSLALLSTLAIAGGCDLTGFNPAGSSSTTSNSIESNAPTSDSESESNSQSASNEDETPDDGGETPDDGGETPDDGGETPDDGGETPDDGGETPDDGGETPDDGGETPDDGGETPDDGGETPDDGGETPDDGGETPDDGGETPDDIIHNELCDFTEWELTTDVSCKADGEMTRYCLKDETHTETQAIPRHPHDFGNNGLCECGASPTLPTLSSAGAINPTKTDSGITTSAPGNPTIEMYNRYILSVDQAYTAVINSNGEFWFQFSIPGPGQYAVVSHSNSNELTIDRYDASAHYVNPAILSGRIMDNGNFISTVSVDDTYYNEEWLTVCCIRGAQVGQKVTFSIIRVGDASWKPSSIYENIYAKQINGVKAPEGTQGSKAIEVPYETTGIYLDKETGWYHMPTGEIIYAAITKNAERQFGGGIAFTDLIEIGSAMNLRIQKSTLPTGDYLIYDYAPMIMSDPTLDGVTNNQNSYEAQVNSDGLYPVTQELHDFLIAHVAKNSLTTAPEAGYEQNAWLSACYYYKVLTPGSQENPIEINKLGSFTATRFDMFEAVYYKFTYTPDIETNTFAAYAINVTTNGVSLSLNGGDAYINANGTFGITNIVFEADPVLGVLLKFSVVSDITIMNIDVSITAVEGSSEKPLIATLGDQTLQPIQAINPDGEITYKACYAYTATADGALTLTSDNADAILQLGVSTLEDGVVTVEVTAGETILLYVENDDGSNVDVNLSFTA